MESSFSSRSRAALETVDYRGNPPVLIVADAPDDEAWRRSAETAGCRVLGVVPVGEGAERLERHAGAEAIVLAVGEDDSTELDPLLDRLTQGSAKGWFGLVISAPPALIERVHSRMLLPEVEQLCEPTPGERVAALRLAAARRPPRLNDVNKAQATVRLQQLSEEVGRIANVLAALSEDETAAAAVASVQGPDPSAGEGVDAGFIRSIIRVRRMRDHFFKSELFADPAWDMLLDLMAARAERQKVAVSSLCIAAAVPPTTALRWIKTLCDQGLLVRVADPEDGRRVFIELSDQAAASLEGYLKSAQRVSSLIV
jgi:DNA-binding MarR family transcriptional regulator